MKPFEKVDHTADIGLRVYGHDMKELFANAVKGTMDLLIGDVEIAQSAGHTINIKGKDRQELLVSLLEEVLYLLNVKRFVTGCIRIARLGGNKLSARLTGETLDSEKHHVEYDIKGVTFHQLKFEKEGDLLTVQVIFDI